MIDEGVAGRARAEVAPIAERTFRELLRSAELPLAPLVEGVRQETFAELERTLLELAQEYSAGDAERRRRCRELVMMAKDHAGWVVRNPKVEADRRADKQEMVLWMLTWLGNPPVFETWVALRKHRLAQPDTQI